MDEGEGRLVLLGDRGNVVVGHRPAPTAELLATAAGEKVTVVGTRGGERVVVAARRFPRFGWTLAIEEPYERAFAPVGRIVRRALALNLVVVLLSSLAAFVLGTWLVQPILSLAEGARRLAAGEGSVRVPEERARDEVRVLARSFNEMAERLEQSRAALERQNLELVRANEVLEQLSITDGLTKLHNHRHFQEEFAREARRAERSGAPLSLVLIDIDDFKRLNDRLGHSVGDRVLQAVARILNDEVRETDYLARYGGEEFALVLPQTPAEGAQALAEKMRMVLASSEIPLPEPEASVRVTVSMGVAPYRGSTSATFDAADRALYQAKAAGKDCVMLAEG